MPSPPPQPPNSPPPPPGPCPCRSHHDPCHLPSRRPSPSAAPCQRAAIPRAPPANRSTGSSGSPGLAVSAFWLCLFFFEHHIRRSPAESPNASLPAPIAAHQRRQRECQRAAFQVPRIDNFRHLCDPLASRRLRSSSRSGVAASPLPNNTSRGHRRADRSGPCRCRPTRRSHFSSSSSSPPRTSARSTK